MGYKEETSTWTGLFGILNAVAKFLFLASFSCCLGGGQHDQMCFAGLWI
jgi:hypothetical protein